MACIDLEARFRDPHQPKTPAIGKNFHLLSAGRTSHCSNYATLKQCFSMLFLPTCPRRNNWAGKPEVVEEVVRWLIGA